MWAQTFQLFKYLFLLPYQIYKVRKGVQNTSTTSDSQTTKVGLFHIPCDTMGGGEKVLWSIVASLLKREGFEVYIYCRPIADKNAMITKANRYYGMHLRTQDINFVEVPMANLTDYQHYTFFSRYLEALSYFVVMPFALGLFMPDLIIESMSAHFSAPTAKICNPNLKYVSYVHFPFTSKEVVQGFKEKMMDKALPPKSRIFAAIKYIYNLPLYWIYKFMGRFPDKIMANSTWTADHCKSNWNSSTDKILIEYPPCNVDEFWSQHWDEKEALIVSFAQFRPEKRHAIQLEIWKKFKRENPNSELKFQIIGSCKDEGSARSADELEQKIKLLGIPDVEVRRNLAFRDIQSTFRKASFGIHTMIDEHFGIAIVEMLAGGMVVMAHNSAGPKTDILKKNGLEFGKLCEDGDFYSTLVDEWKRFKDDKGRKEQIEMIKKGQDWCKGTLTNEAFGDRLYKVIEVLL